LTAVSRILVAAALTWLSTLALSPATAQSGAEEGLGRPTTAQAQAQAHPNAHWLVTTNGERIETRGAWRVEGQRVLFTAPNGALISLRVSQVDLDASRAVELAETHAEGASPRPPLAPSPPREPRLVLTEKELPPITAAESSTSSDAAAAESPTPSAAAPSPGAGSEELNIIEWRNVAATGEPLQIYGTLRNDASGRRSGLAVTIRVFDESGEEVANQPALLQDSSLEAGRSTSFRVFFPEIERYARLEIEASHR
jgi:hypothetical protein